MLLPNLHPVDIHTVPKPPITLSNLYIIPAHHTLPHPAILREGPILQAIATLPLHPVVGILVLVPELDSDLVVAKSEELLA